jgi:hypothetical protein
LKKGRINTRLKQKLYISNESEPRRDHTLFMVFTGRMTLSTDKLIQLRASLKADFKPSNFLYLRYIWFMK